MTPEPSSNLTKTQVRTLLRDALDPIVTPAGFKAKRDGQKFSRRIPGGRQTLSVALWDWRPRFEFTVSMGVRLDIVEEFMHPFTRTDPRYQAETLTSLTQLEFLGFEEIPGRGVIFGGDSRETIEREAADLARIVREQVIPFFEEYRSLQAVEQGLNPTGAEALTSPIWPEDRRRFDGSIEPYRAMHGIATAYLIRSSRLPALVDAYRGQLSGMVAEIRERYETLADFVSQGSNPG